MWQGPERISGPFAEGDVGQRIAKLVDAARELQEGGDTSRTVEIIAREKDAIEETISCLDNIGFFLLGDPPKLVVDSRLKAKAPIMVDILGS